MLFKTEKLFKHLRLIHLNTIFIRFGWVRCISSVFSAAVVKPGSGRGYFTLKIDVDFLPGQFAYSNPDVVPPSGIWPKVESGKHFKCSYGTHFTPCTTTINCHPLKITILIWNVVMYNQLPCVSTLKLKCQHFFLTHHLKEGLWGIVTVCTFVLQHQPVSGIDDHLFQIQNGMKQSEKGDLF